MPDISPRFRRKRFIVKRGFQFRYIGLVFMLAILASLVTGYTVFATGWGILVDKLAGVYPQGRLLYILRAANLSLLRNILLISPFILISALLFSHKIAGPVYRIEKSLDEIARGNLLLKIRLRKGDELTDLAEMINILTERIDKTISDGKINITGIRNSLIEIKKLSSSNVIESRQIEFLVSGIEEKIKLLQDSFNKWVTSN